MTGLVDAFDGIGDLERGVIRCVGNAMERFSEDALRMLRAVRFAAQLGFSIEQETQEAIAGLAGNIKKVSAERIQVELVKLLTSPNPGELKVAYRTGLTAVFLPEFDVMMETPQNNPHHCCSVGEHTLKAIERCRRIRCSGLRCCCMTLQSLPAGRRTKKVWIIFTDIRCAEARWRVEFCAG